MSAGVLVAQLGSPDSPSVADVRRYLAQFLMDPYVIDIPYIQRWLLIHGIILRTRPKKSAHAYQSIWTEEGSPLVVTSRKLTERLQSLTDLPVELGMRYGNPSLETAFMALLKRCEGGLKDLYLLPQYPHYAMSTVTTVVEEVKTLCSKNNVRCHVMPVYYSHPTYINLLSETIKPYVDSHEVILLSYHGIPERHLGKTDPTHKHCLKTPNCCETPSIAHGRCYRYQCYENSRLVGDKLGLSKEQLQTSFQSRLGKDPWLQPYTDQTLVALAKQGIKHLAVACPSFSVDCLETLEEIGMEGKKLFLENGGQSYTLIPCLNDNSKFVDFLNMQIKDLQTHVT